MSYGTIKIGNAAQDSNGNIQLNTTDLSDTLSSFNNNKLLGWNGSSFGEILPSGNNKKLYYSWTYRPTSSSVFSSSKNYSNSNWYVWRTYSGSNTYKHTSVSTSTASASNNGFLNNTSWTESLTVTEDGTYFAVASVPLGSGFTSNDSATFQWKDESNNVLGPKMLNHSEEMCVGLVWGIFTRSGTNKTVHIEINDIVGTANVTDGGEAKFWTFNLYKFN